MSDGHYLLDTYRPLIEDAFFELNGIVKENFRQVDEVMIICMCKCYQIDCRWNHKDYG